MGLDQHRAQITAEWIDTATGEVSRARVAPADRAGVRRFAARFRGEDLEAALEATTGWRFVVEEFTGGGRGGDDGLAVRRGGVHGGRRAGSSRRAVRDGGAARAQEARQERPRRRQA